MYTLIEFLTPVRLSDHFDIPVDTSQWTGPPGSYIRAADGKGFSPAREKASFGTIAKSMLPKTEVGIQLQRTHGIYVLAFDIPKPAIYVGIAAEFGKSPEGVMGRVRKHRIKLTSSHVGTSPTNYGGVKHTGGWREYAEARVHHFESTQESDACSDGRISCGQFKASGPDGQHKEQALWFENQLTTKYLNRLIKLLWPDVSPGDVFLLTKGTNTGQRPEQPKIAFWDGEVFDA